MLNLSRKERNYLLVVLPEMIESVPEMRRVNIDIRLKLRDTVKDRVIE